MENICKRYLCVLRKSLFKVLSSNRPTKQNWRTKDKVVFKDRPRRKPLVHSTPIFRFPTECGTH